MIPRLGACAILFSVLLLALSGPPASAQDVLPLDKITSQADLERTIKTLDAELFNAYNHCDLP
ncbi:MAG: hypothetical protein ACHP8A_06320, partial [Terriglobales bacterium]